MATGIEFTYNGISWAEVHQITVGTKTAIDENGKIVFIQQDFHIEADEPTEYYMMDGE